MSAKPVYGKPDIIKEQSMVVQKEMLAAYFQDLSRAKETGKNRVHFVKEDVVAGSHDGYAS